MEAEAVVVAAVVVAAVVVAVTVVVAAVTVVVADPPEVVAEKDRTGPLAHPGVTLPRVAEAALACKRTPGRH